MVQILRTTSVALGAVMLSGCGGQADQTADALGGDVVVLSGARLIDGGGGPPLENATLVIRGDRIEAVGAAGSVEVPAGAETIDLTGKTIMPGIINLHGHIGQTVGLVNSVTNYTDENVRAKLDLYARYGVLHVVSLGRDQPLIYEIRRQQRAGQIGGARVHRGRGLWS